MLALLILIIIVVLVLTIFLLNSITNIWSLQRLGEFPDLENYPKVSVIVPARNEERNIKRCVDSLLQQDYPNYEVLVLNDNSTDKTEEILAQYNHPKLQVFNGQPLPEDWLGKHWACHQMAERATGELFLFVDADTYHHPNALKSAVNALTAEKADFITALPKEEISSWSENLVLPIISWSLVTFMPLFLAKRSRRPALSATIGQFMLFKKAAYQKIGGYSAIRGEVLDDVIFGRRVKAFGLTWRMFDGTKRIRCWMYTNFKETYQGLTRCIFAVFKNNIFYFLFSILTLLFVFLGPWIIVILKLSGVGISEVTFWLSLTAIIITTFTWLIANIRFKYSYLLTVFHPLIIIFVGYIAFSSMIKTFGGKIVWKGRLIKYF